MMNRILENVRRGQYVSLFAVLSLTFYYAADFRYYVNRSVYSAFDLGNLGAFGQKLRVSVLIAVFAALGWAIGVLTAFLTRKKRINSVTLYWLAGLFAIVALLFTPYNLQLLMPSEIMQNIAMISCIAHIVFVFADMWIFAWTFCVGVIRACAQSGRYYAALISSIAVVAAVLAYLSIALGWSFVALTSVYGCVLAALNILHAAFPERTTQDENAKTSVCPRVTAVTVLSVSLLFAAVLIGACFITENLIAI